MSIMDFFRQPAPATPANTQVAQSGQTPPAATTPTGATNPTNPTVPAGQPQQTADAAKSPLDAFAELWKIDPTKQPAGTPEALFNIDPAKLQEAASKTDFSQVITPETVQRMSAGGEDAVKAFVESMNKVAQATYAQSAMASATIVQQALAKAQESYDARIPNLIKQHTVSDNLRTENPALNNPAVAPLISAMEIQFTQKFPQASAAEITKMAKEYISTIATAFAPPAPAAQSQQAGTVNGEYDFSSFLK